MDPQAIVDALAGSQPQLTRLAGAISGDHNSAQALFVPLIGGISGGIAADQPSVQAIATAISRTPRALDAIASAIAADQNLADAIVNAAGAGAPLAVVAVAGQPVPCGTVPTIGDGQARDVRSGYCFPDLNNGCNGSILTNPADPKTGIMLKNYYKRDSLFVNFANTSYRDLATIVDPGNAAFKMQPDDLANPDQNVFNYRNFFLIDPSDESFIAAALRESHEEINLQPSAVEVLGQLDPMVTRFGVKVTPVVGIISPDIILTPNPDELDSIFRVPVSFLVRDERMRTDRGTVNGHSVAVPCWNWQGYEIWGVTAIILVNFMNRVLGQNISTGVELLAQKTDGLIMPEAWLSTDD